MPNVSGLLPADALISAFNGTGTKTIEYGPHAQVTLDVNGAVLTNKAGVRLAYVATSGKPSAKLALIDGDTVTPVNAFLRPFGKVKVYWRTGEYRWHPASGTPTTPVKRASKALVAPVVPVATPVVATPAPVVAPTVVATVVAPTVVPTTNGGVIETVRRWQDVRSKRPVVKPGVKGYVIADDVLVPEADVRQFDVMKKRRDAGHVGFGLITGPAGTAKTRFAQAWGFVNDLPVVIVEGQSIQTAGDWFGQLLPNASGVGAAFEWVWSDAAKLIMTGQPCLIVLDELNRPENERALNGVMGLTDWKGTVRPMGAPHALHLAPGQCIVATLNEGAEFVGTVEVDAAVRNRFSHGVRMDYAPKLVEERILLSQVPNLDPDKAKARDIAKRLVQVAAGQRAKRDDDAQYPSHNVIGTRTLVDVADSIAFGADPKEALWGAIKSAFWPEDFTALNVLIEAQFGPDPVEVEGDDEELDEDDVEQMLSGV